VSNATFTAVSVKTALTLVFCLQFCVSASALKKARIQQGFILQIADEDERLMFQAGC
jgi:uncharacterized protein YcgL (UPF0745 family)